MKTWTIRDIATLGILTAILFVQEQLLSLPNIQLTVFLIVLYSKCLGLKKTLIIVFIHVIFDNLIMGSFNFVYVPFMMIGWMIIPLVMAIFFKRVNESFKLALLGIAFALIYSWIMIIPQVLITNVDFIPYFLADIPFEGMLALSSFVTILWLYEPTIKVFNKLNN